MKRLEAWLVGLSGRDWLMLILIPTGIVVSVLLLVPDLALVAVSLGAIYGLVMWRLWVFRAAKRMDR